MPCKDDPDELMNPWLFWIHEPYNQKFFKNDIILKAAELLLYFCEGR